MTQKRILFYSHDTFGLGHIRRTQKIANALAGDNRSILIACSSPKASSYNSELGIEYLNLPGFTKLVTGKYQPRNLGIPIDEFVNLRSSLLLSATRAFDPDVLIVDKVPLGVKKELLPALEHLKYHHPTCQTICGFRDLLDNKEATLKEWQDRGTEQALEAYFDSIWIYGEKEFFDFADEYSLSPTLAKRLVYTGYVNPTKSIEETNDIELAWNDDKPIVTFTLGGGGDGWENLSIYLDALEENIHRSAFNTFILTGPFADAKLIESARKIAFKRDDVQVASFLSNTDSLFRKSDVVVSMGGYNTMCELSAMGKYPLILPRIIPRTEQLIRAKAFHKQGLCDYIHPNDMNKEHLIEKIISMLKENEGSATRPTLDSRGLDVIKFLI